LKAIYGENNWRPKKGVKFTSIRITTLKVTYYYCEKESKNRVNSII
jgi:hypothetical protein